MYCSTCGVAVAQGLSYCNYCGAKLGSKEDEDTRLPKVRPELLVSAIAGLFIFGLMAMIMLMGVMRVILGLTVESVLAISLFPFLLLLFLEGMFIRLLFRGKGKSDSAQTLPAVGTTRELDAAHARSLTEHRPSVTEHTTRAFQPIHTDQRSE